MSAATTVRRISTRSTVNMPGETMPGSDLRPSGPPTTSVKFRSSMSLRLGTTSLARPRRPGGWVSSMESSLPVCLQGYPQAQKQYRRILKAGSRRCWLAVTAIRRQECSAKASQLLVHQDEHVIPLLLQQIPVEHLPAGQLWPGKQKLPKFTNHGFTSHQVMAVPKMGTTNKDGMEKGIAG